MKFVKLTHHLDVIKKEVDSDEDDNISATVDGKSDFIQDYHYKKELDIPWKEEDNDFGTSKENHDFLYELSRSKYPIVLLERLSNDVIDKHSSANLNVRKSFRQYYRKFCPNCNKTAPYSKNTGKCKNCDVLWNYECKKCNETLATYKGFVHHLTTKCIENGDYYACFKCDYKSISKYRVKVHLVNVHSIRNSLNRIEKFVSQNVQNDVEAAMLHKCKKCGKQFQRLHSLLLHTQICGQAKDETHDGNSTANIISLKKSCLHHCAKCNVTLRHDKIGSFHLKMCKKCDSKLSFKCKQCNKIFNWHTNIYRHLKTSHANKQKQTALKCHECDYQTFSMEYLTKHVKRTHIVQIQECSKCGGEYKNLTALKIHMSYCQKKRKFQCDHCSYKSNRKSLLKTHYYQVHLKGKNLECPQCGVSFKNKNTLGVHLQYCGKERDHCCNVCPFKTKYKYHLTVHYKNIHSEVQQTQTCSRCAKQLKNESTLRCHLRYCGKKPDLPCNYCSRLFKNKYLLKQHIDRLHAQDEGSSKLRYLQCKNCTYKTKFKSDLAKHVITHLDNAQKCPKCQKKFRNEYFKRHTAYCGKPLTCELCAFKASSKSGLRQHMQSVHTKDKVDCQKCGSTFKNKLYLRAHQRRCGVKPGLQCDHCAYKTRYKFKLKMHLEKNHSQEMHSR